jgi:hypothetical protein
MTMVMRLIGVISFAIVMLLVLMICEDTASAGEIISVDQALIPIDFFMVSVNLGVTYSGRTETPLSEEVHNNVRNEVMRRLAEAGISTTTPANCGNIRQCLGYLELHGHGSLLRIPSSIGPIEVYSFACAVVVSRVLPASWEPNPDTLSAEVWSIRTTASATSQLADKTLFDTLAQDLEEFIATYKRMKAKK